MGNKIKTLVILLIAAICIGNLFPQTVFAANEKNAIYKLQVEKYLAEMKQVPENNLVFATKLEKAEKVKEPFVIYHVGEDQQDKVYYYPITDNDGVIQLMVEAIIIDDVAECNLSDNLVDLMNQIDYEEEDIIVYRQDNCIFVETPSESLNAYYFYNEPKQRLMYTVESEWNTTFEEKKATIENATDNMTEFEPIGDIDEFLNIRMGGSLSLTNPMGQYGYGMCWASSVATVHNYLTNTVITGFEVCNRMGIGYDAGGTIYDEQDALAKYNITYNSIRGSALTWSQLTGNIDASKPIIANGSSSGTIGHAVTIYGYSGTSSSLSNVKIWNSNANNGTGGYSTFNYSSGYFTDASGTAYTWGSSLSYQ